MFKANKNTNILTLTGIFALFAVTMVTGPLALTMGDNGAFAKSSHRGNDADQETSQGQSSDQDAQCVSGEDIVLSCNNIAYKGQSNEGDSASGQQGKNGNGGSNDADQSTEQGQSSRQNAQCVAGGSIALSCNNLSFKDQSNEGHSALGQQGKNGNGGSNDADQSTEQGQYADQDAQCVSGEDAIVSCNNAEFQNMVNSGNRALAQD
ncbi:MAG: hypothetical protein WKF36_04185 [Candidatus Nitrosocosmicus sp.]